MTLSDWSSLEPLIESHEASSNHKIANGLSKLSDSMFIEWFLWIVPLLKFQDALYFENPLLRENNCVHMSRELTGTILMNIRRF